MEGRTAGVLLLVAGLLAGARVQDEDWQELRAREVQELVEGLAGFAAWCGESKLYGQRAETYRLILGFDPDHEEARRGLGHKRGPDGAWREVPLEREPRDHDAKALARAPTERAKVIDPFCERLVALAAEVPENGAPPEARAALLADVLRVAPDHPGAHGLAGEARAEDGAWVLRETLVAKERRAAIKDAVRAAYQGAPAPQVVELLPREREVGVALRGAAAGPLVRVAGTVGDDELARTCRALHAAHAAFGTLLGITPVYHEDFTVFLLAPSDEEAFLAGHPAVTDEMRGFLATLESSGIQGTGDFASWAPDEERRRDAAVRFALGWMLEVAFGTTTEQGWVYEGLGLYLTREIVGTRLSWFVQPSELTSSSEDMGLRARLLEGDTNWMNEALVVLRKEQRPKLADVLARTANELRTEDLLLAYVTAAYLLEARTPEETGELLRRAGRGLPPEKVVAPALGMGVDELDGRVLRWLSERR